MNTGDIITCTALGGESRQFRIGDAIDQGGQGSLWHARARLESRAASAPSVDPSEQNAYVFKLINDPSDEKKQHKIRNIRALTRRARHLNPTNQRFSMTLPLYLYESGREFGYIMELAHGENLNAMMNAKKFDNMSDTDRMALLCRLAESISFLCDNGLCYQDISPHNFMYRPADATHPEAYVTLIDCDNITSDAVARAGNATFAKGSTFYEPPEVAFGLAPPSSESDCYALALLFFKLFMVKVSIPSPYHGRELYSKYPLMPFTMEDAVMYVNDEPTYGLDWLTFVFDPVNRINAIDPTLHRSSTWQENQRKTLEIWEGIPQNLKDLFVRAFASPLDAETRKKRPRASTWLSELQKCLEANPSAHSTPEQPDAVSFIRGSTLHARRELVCPFSLDAQNTDGFVDPPMGIVEQKENGRYVFRSTSPMLMKYRDPGVGGSEIPLHRGGEIELNNGIELFFAISPSERVKFILSKSRGKNRTDRQVEPVF